MAPVSDAASPVYGAVPGGITGGVITLGCAGLPGPWAATGSAIRKNAADTMAAGEIMGYRGCVRNCRLYNDSQRYKTRDVMALQGGLADLLNLLSLMLF